MIAVPGGGQIATQSVDTSDEVKGAAPKWHLVSVVADIPTWATGLQFAIRLGQNGVAWVSDTSFEVVDASIPLSSGGSPIKFRAEELKGFALSPENLDFTH